VTLLLVASRFTPELQGYYYTFNTLLAMQVFIELGLGYVIMQFASHEWAQLRLDGHGRIVGDPQALSKLVSLGQFAIRWYIVGGGLTAVGLGIAGWLFFSYSPQIVLAWTAPWLVLCLLTGLNLCLLPLWSLLEGCNQVAQVYAYRLGQGILGSLFAWSAIWLGAGLWTGAIAAAVTLVWALLCLCLRYRQFFYQFCAAVPGPRLIWRSEIWPLQWRIALSWLSGYLSFALFTPIAFQLHGPVIAGQIGMTWTLTSGLSAVAATWVVTKAPQFGAFVAGKKYADLDRLALRLGIAAVGVACCGAIAIEGLVYFLYTLHHPLATRLLPPLPTGLFLLATVLLQISYTQSTYLRAHKQEPMLGLSVLTGLLIGLSTVVLGKYYGAMGMAVGYLAVVTLVALPLGTVIWYHCRAEWHRG
jgi:hypothetical protein